MKKIEEDTNKWKDTLCSQIERINTVKISTQPKATYKFNALPFKIPIAFFTEIEKKNPKIFVTKKNPNREIMIKQNKARTFTLPDYKLQSMAIPS